jgi:glycosyltransferase involved in cell wall biosynthesis
MKKINLSCPINQTGYGISSFNILKELNKISELSYLPIGQPSVGNQEDYNIVQSLLNNQDLADINSPFIKIWHQFDLGTRFGRGKYFGFPFFELDTFNTREKQHLSVPDVVFATSEWAKQVILDNGINVKVEVVPLGVDTEIFQYDKYMRTTKDKYIFLNIGKWEVRKGHDILLDLFQQAFPEEKDVELWILASETTNGYSTPEQIEEWKKKYSGDERIRLSPGAESHQQIAHIMSQADCGIFPSRAEGWNLELLEMMAMNKPTIATNYSAHTEFCNKDNCHLIDIDETELAVDGKAFYGQGNWAKLGQNQFDQTIEYMRNMYKNKITTNPEGLKTAQAFSWKNSASKILGCIE